MDAFINGFSDIILLNDLRVFNEQELQYLVSGFTEIDIDDWRKNTIYKGGYKETDDVIIWFWKVIESLDNELRARLLHFVTSSSRVPLNGFTALIGSNGPQKFCIKRLGCPETLPRAHTSFNRIDLPPYSVLRTKLLFAVQNAEIFEGVN